jgi:hypothetical protein
MAECLMNASLKKVNDGYDLVSLKATIDEHLRSYDERHMRDFMDVYVREMKQNPESPFTSK